MDENVSLVTLAIIALPILVGLVIGILKLTAWGKRNAAALDVVSEGLELAKRSGGELNAALSHLSKQELTQPPAVVQTWKAVHRRVKDRLPKY